MTAQRKWDKIDHQGMEHTPMKGKNVGKHQFGECECDESTQNHAGSVWQECKINVHRMLLS